MSPEPPAGYFSTFSILDPNNTSPEGHPRSQKRNRRVFVCIPCHKRKLKCDKRLPCSRCVASGNAEDCVYQPFPSSPKQDATPERETPAMTPPRSAAKQYIKARVSPATSRFPGHGSTYWATVASEVSDRPVGVMGILIEELTLVQLSLKKLYPSYLVQILTGSQDIARSRTSSFSSRP